MGMSTAENTANLRELAEQSHAWPFEEARKIVARLKKTPKDAVIFETGYGPSGLPHIGTFGEVARTTMVRHAFRLLTDDKIITRLIAFSDDMDGLRKVPDNVPNKDMVAKHLGKSLTQVPDPFGTHDSFAAHNNARLRAFLDQFGFDYEFMSSTECYTSGRFDAALLKVLERFDAVMNIMLPSLREERAESYSPFLPISPRTGIVLQVPVVAHDAKAGTITYEDPDTEEHVTTLVTGGRCKLQWKPDWAMRWVALGVDYEMAGKDLIDSVKLSGEICRALGGTPPEGFNYELFLDENGQKISKSKGNGLTIDEWLRYASPASLSLFMYREPKAAKRLYFDVIPRHVDEYLQFLDAYPRQGAKEQLGNPVWHIHSGAPPKADNPVPFAMLLSLVTASNAENAETLWGFIGRYRPGVTKETHPYLAAMVEYAIHYFRDFVLPAKKFREPFDAERAALIDLRDALSQLAPDAPAEAIQDVVYEVGRREPFLDAKKKGKDGKPGVSLDWFNMLYQVLLGQEKGPRFGSFVAAYGIKNTIDLIDGRLAPSTTTHNTSTTSTSTKTANQDQLRGLYCDLMEEVKTRHSVIESVLGGKVSLPAVVASELCYLQLRMICELIALACLAAHGDIEATRKGKLFKAYNADQIIKDLGRLHPDFYPHPTRQIVNEKGVPVRVVPITSGYLTKEELLNLYAECGSELHRGSIKNITSDALEDQPDVNVIRNHIEKIVTLLNHHHLQLIDPEFQLWVLMKGKETGRVRFAVMKKVDGANVIMT
jgi:lysyl-tRNA synthetase class 1